MSASQICRVSQNLSLRLSPERKYPPRTFSSISTLETTNYRRNYTPICFPSYCCYRYFCCNCCCYHYYRCCCCCCCPSLRDDCLYYDYNKMSSSEDLNNPLSKKYGNENPSSSQYKRYNPNENPNEKDDNQNKSLNPNENENPNQSQNPNEDQSIPQMQKQNTYFSYEQNQFNDFLRKLMEVESKIEDAKINLSQNPDFNCEDVFRLFEANDKGYLDENDIKKGLNSIGVNPSDFEIKLLMKRFDLQKNGNINYADFFDMIVPFEKNVRTKVENRNPNQKDFSPNTINGLKELFNLIINSENEINNMRKGFGTLRLNLRDIFGLIDKANRGYFEHGELIEYFKNNGMLNNNRDADLLFIRLDKYRKGRIDYPQVEDEIQTLY